MPDLNYTEFDAALLAHIAAKRNTAMVLEHQQDLLKLAASHPGSLGKPLFRFIDRRLQKLRTDGRITFDRKTGWQVVEAKS